MTPIRVLLADDHPIVREGLRTYLSSQPTLSVVGEASNGMEVFEKAAALAPHIVLMDIAMPGLSGIETTRHLHGSRSTAKVLILSAHDEREYLLESFRAGARGYVLKDSAPSDVLRAIEAVHAGDPFYTVGTARLVFEEVQGKDWVPPPPSEGLSARQREILRLACQGLKSREIAARLDISIRTVDGHRRSIKRKLGVHTMAGLMRYALQNGLITIQE